MAISNVLADVRGMATMGPTHRMIAHMRISDGTQPTRWSTASLLPTRSSANMAASASPMSAIKYALNPASHCGPDSMPRYGGKITFPAPEEHGKQCETDNDDVACRPIFRLFHVFSPFAVRARTTAFNFQI